MTKSPLAGIRVIELARVLAGPWAGQVLADLGADVIKVENPDGGDDTRHWGPPFIEGADGENLSAAYFHSTNRGKRSVAADFRQEEGLQLVKRLIAQSDVLIENFRTGGLNKYGLDYESVARINPGIVYCSITGFGQTGPLAPVAGYDFIIQGMSGFMSITGEPDGQPMKAGVAIADIFTGMYAVVAIQAALYHARETGRGQHIDMALLDAQAGILANQNLNYLSTGKSPGRMGNAHPNISPYEVVPTSDGHLILAVGNDGQFRRLCAILDLEAEAADPRFASNASRVAHRGDVHDMLADRTIRFTRDQLLSECELHGVPAGPINSIGEMFEDPQIVARGLRLSLQDDRGNIIPGVASPIRMSETPLTYKRPSPRLGQHTREVEEELKRIEND